MKMMPKSIIILFITALSFPLAQAQDFAGENQTICQGEGATIGNPSAPDEYCYKWSPEIGFESSSVEDKTPTVNPPHTIEYTVVATSQDFLAVFTDTVKITVGLGGVRLANEHVEPDSTANQTSASITETPPNTTINWKIEGDDRGCEIDDVTGKISYCHQFGTVTVRAFVVGDEDCYADATLYVDADVREVWAIDNAHPQRRAKNGDTLHLVGHNDVKLMAVPFPNESFGSNQPDWSGSTVSPPTPHAVEWVHDDGAYSFMEIKAGNKTVYVKRHQAGSVGVGNLTNGLVTAFTAIAQKIKPPESVTVGFTGNYDNSSSCTPISGEAEFLNFSYSAVPVEKWHDPGWDWKQSFAMNNSASLTGKFCAPPPYSSPPNPLFIYNVYIQAGGSINLNAALTKDPSTTFEAPWLVSNLDLLGSVNLGVGGAIGFFVPGEIFGIQGSVFGGVVATFNPTFRVPKDIVMTIRIEPLVVTGNLKVFWTNPNNLIVDLNGRYNLMDPITLPSQGEYSIVQLKDKITDP